MIKDLFFLFNNKQRVKFLKICGLVSLSVMMEMLAIISIPPTIFLIVNRINNDDMPFKMSNLGHLASLSPTQILSLLICIFFIKSILGSYVALKQTEFGFDFQAIYSAELLNRYMQMDSITSTADNTGVLIRNVTYEVSLFSHSFLIPLMNAISEILILIGIGISLFLIDLSTGYITLTLFAVSYLIFGYGTRKITKIWADERQRLDGESIHIAQQCIRSRVEIAIYRAQKFFHKYYSEVSKASANISSKQMVMLQLPRLWLDTLAISSIAILFIVKTDQADNRFISAYLAVFVAAIFRMMPSLVRLISSLQSCRYSYPVLKVLAKELKTSARRIQPHYTHEELKSEILIRNLNYSYSGSEKKVLSDVNLSIKKNQTVGIVGPSGSGKSTILKVLLGLVTPAEGLVIIDGVVAEKGLFGLKSMVGYVAQNPFIFNATVATNIALNEIINDLHAIECLNSAGILEVIVNQFDGLNGIISDNCSNLSGGQMQRLALSRALYQSHGILIFDEPTSALDKNSQKTILETFERLKKDHTIIIVTHSSEVLKVCDVIYSINQGVVTKIK